MTNLHQAFKSLKDSRIWRNRKHGLWDIIILSIPAVLGFFIRCNTPAKQKHNKPTKQVYTRLTGYLYMHVINILHN